MTSGRSYGCMNTHLGRGLTELASRVTTFPEPPVVVDERVARARAGDVEAFEDLYKQHVRRIYAICMRMTANPSLAEELTQDAFIRAWEKMDLFHGDSGFGPWLQKVAVNVVLSDRRSRARRRARELSAIDVSEMDPPDRPSSPAARIDLEQAMARLPEGARTVFFLHDVEGYAHEEIAQLLGVASGTSKAQLHRARKLLREVLRT